MMIYIWYINTCTWKVVGHLDLSIFYYPFQSGPHETLTQKPRGFHCRSRFRGANCGGFGWSRIFLWCHCLFLGHLVMWMFPKIVGFPPKSSILIGFSIIFTIHFGVPICLEPPILMQAEVSFVFLNAMILWWKFVKRVLYVMMCPRDLNINLVQQWYSWWFRNTKANQRLGCISRTPANNGRFHLPFPSTIEAVDCKVDYLRGFAPRSGGARPLRLRVK